MKRTSSGGIKGPAVIAWIIYLVSVIPLLILARYSYPAVDDYTMGYRAHEFYLQSRSMLKTLLYAIPAAGQLWASWIGYYTSAAFSAVPPSTFSPDLYFLSVWGILLLFTIAVTVFMKQLMVRTLEMDAGSCAFITAMMLLMMVHLMPEEARVEAFFWHCGSWNYTATFSLGLLFVASLLALNKKRARKAEYAGPLLIACILGALCGGGNYLTAVSLLSFGLLWFAVMLIPASFGQKNDGLVNKPAVITILPILVFCIGFAVSCMAPGNAIRSSYMVGFAGLGPVKSIVISLYYTIRYCINIWLHAEHLLVYIILAPVFWYAESGIKKLHFSRPVIVILAAYGLSSACITPSVYTNGSVGSGRIIAVFYMQFILLSVLTEGYLIGWLKNRLVSGEAGLADFKARILIAPAAALLIVVAMTSGAAADHYTGTEAVYELASGQAALWQQENKVRESMLFDDKQTDPVLPRHTVNLQLLSTMDITEDPADWINTGVARFYHKNSVGLEPAPNSIQEEQ